MNQIENKACIPAYRFKVTNLTAEKCAVLIEHVLRDLPGVKSISVNVKKQVAVIHGYICTKALIETAQQAGFSAELLKNFLNNSHIYYYYY